MPAGHSARLKAAELREQAIQLHAQAMKREDDATHWEAGAVGEERVAAALELAGGPSTRVLHDRLLRPGTASKANIDHLFVSERGIFLVDAKNWTGDVVGDETSLRQRASADGRKGWSRARELTNIRDAAVDVQAAVGYRVTPVLCLAGEKAAEFGPPQEIDGVHVLPIDALQPWLGARPTLRRAVDVGRVAVDLSCRYPEATGDAAAILPPATAATPPPLLRPAVSRRAASVRSPRRPAGGAIRIGTKAVLGLIAVVLAITIGPHLIASITRATANTVAAAGQVPTASSSSSVSPARLRSLDNWTVRAELYEAHDQPEALPYEPDSGLDTQSAACRNQKATLAPLRHALLAAPDKTLAAGAKRYDHAVRDLLHACMHDKPVALHHARSRMDAAASAVNVRYNRLLGIDPGSYEAKHVL